jgi:hypothetical protein
MARLAKLQTQQDKCPFYTYCTKIPTVIVKEKKYTSQSKHCYEEKKNHIQRTSK